MPEDLARRHLRACWRTLARRAPPARSVYLASTFDGPLGIAAGVHTAAALRISRACGLATLQNFAEPTGAPQPRGGSIAVPSVPGLA